MMLRTVLPMACLVTGLFVIPVSASECRQQTAVYQDNDKTYELRFSTVDSQAAATSHIFKVAIKNTDLLLDGVVLPTEDVTRSTALVMNNCPEGDVTGHDLKVCTIWENVVYGIDAGGTLGNLPAGDAPASAKILLADFGRSLRASSIWGAGQATVVPWDVFTLSGCAS